MLEPIKVVNPFAEYLNIPTEVLKPRRTNNHYLQFIEAVTFYHQYQREQKADIQTGEIFIETTLEDIKEANKLLKEILLRKSDELTGACRNYLEAVKSYLEQENKAEYTNAEIRKALKINASNQKRYNLNLLENHYIKKVKGKTGTAYSYEITSYEEFKQLREQVAGVLDENIKHLKERNNSQSGSDRFTSSKAVQKPSEPLKKKKPSKIAV